MNVKNITTTVAGLMLIAALSTGCRHHREVVYVNNNTPPPTTVVYNNTPPPVVNSGPVYVQPQAIPPVVSITYPATNFASAGNYITVQGNIQYIQSAHQVSVSQNGYPVRYFAYDPYSGNFHFQTFLQPGANNIIVTANSPYGTGSQGVTVFFNAPTTYINGGGGGYYPPNNSINPNANIVPRGGGNYPNNSINPNANIAPNGGNYPNNSINPNAINNNGGGNYPNNSINPNANITPNGSNYPNNSINPNAINNNNGGGNNYPNNPINPNINGGGNNQGQGSLPIIQYTNPSSTPLVVSAASYNVSALVQNVKNGSEVTVNINGTNTQQFNFNPFSHTLNFPVNLSTGFNSIHISATNGVGTTSQSTVIDYKPAVGSAPRIQIFNPATSPFSSIQQNIIVSGYVYNVTSSSEITASFNGSPISFSYNQSTQEIEVPLNLTSSTNQLVINASNPSGTDSKPITLVLVNNNPHVAQQNLNLQTNGNVLQPNGSINNSNNNPHVAQQNPNLQTNGVTYIDQNMNGTNNNPHVAQQNPNLQTNGVIQPNGTNSNNNPHVAQQTSNLSTNGVTYIDQNMNGTNNNPHVAQTPNLSTNGVTYIDQNMNGTNNAPHTGQQNQNLQTNGVTYIDQHPNTNSGGTSGNGMAGLHHAPEITRTSPVASPYTTMSGVISAAANVSYVTNASEVSVTYNGSSVSFSYNPQVSEALNFTSPLSPGMNTFVIKATNSYGTNTQDISVNYVPTNTSGNVNGNPGTHFPSGMNVASNTPRELNTNQRTEPAKINTAVKPVQPTEKQQPKKK